MTDLTTFDRLKGAALVASSPSSPCGCCYWRTPERDGSLRSWGFSAKDLRAARALFGKVSDDFLSQQILEDCPECGEVAAASPGVERLR